jgi:hypothetical protein
MNNEVKGAPVDLIPTWRSFSDIETGAKYTLLIAAALQRKQVTLNQAYHSSLEERKQGHTLFREITINAPQIPKSIQELMQHGSALANNDIPSIARALSNVIERGWDPHKFHLVMHSSGYDSRIISKTIANLRDKNGKSWLGEILFLCWEPEGAIFKQIMSLEGWDQTQYRVCNETAQQGEYYAGALNFNNCWKWTNDAPPVWVSGPDIEYCRETGIITKPLAETQVIAGGGGNECFAYSPQYLIDMFYYSKLSGGNSSIIGSEKIYPFLSWDVLNLVKLYSSYPLWIRGFPSLLKLLKLELPLPVWRMRERILAYLSPSLIKLKTGPIDGPMIPQRQLSERLKQECLRSFTDSWYYANVIRPNSPERALDIPRCIWINDWWGEYAKAATCEHIIRNGVAVRL